MIRSLNPVIGKNLSANCTITNRKDENKKEARNDPSIEKKVELGVMKIFLEFELKEDFICASEFLKGQKSEKALPRINLRL